MNKNQRADIRQANQKLDELREIPMKTLEEQKEFLNTKYPKRVYDGKKWYQKITLMGTLKFIVHLVAFIFLLNVWSHLFRTFDYTFPLWGAVVTAIGFPIIYNIVMGKFGLNKSNDLSVYFRK